MNERQLFLALVCVQALHSLEEYTFRLWEVLPPARMISIMISSDLARGFAIANMAIAVVGFACYLWPVRLGWAIARPIGWIWVAIEFVNGVGHPGLSLIERRYLPGTVTAPILLVLSIALARRLVRCESHSA